MRRLVTQGRDTGGRVAERRERRHLDEVAGGREERLVPAVADHCAGIREEAIGMLDALNRIPDRLGLDVVSVREPIDLTDIECGVSLQERDLPIEFSPPEPTSVLVNRLTKTTVAPPSPFVDHPAKLDGL